MSGQADRYFSEQGMKVVHGTRHGRVLHSFFLYCAEHPNERFWQALRNWAGWPFVWVSDRLDDSETGPAGNVRDTFYWEGRDG